MALAASALLSVAAPREARAQSTLKSPGRHPSYAVELEPHAAFGVFDPPGPLTGDGLGVGFRASLPILRTGFVKSINDSVAIGFGADALWYFGRGDGTNRAVCRATAPGPSGTTVCVDASLPGGSRSSWFYVHAPVVLQWSFWLTDRWSVFGEPGLTFTLAPPDDAGARQVRLSPAFYVGGRYLFSPRSAVTLRLGYPTISIGVSFFP